MSLSDVDLSRAVSHALRHEPWLYELELDDEGWAPVEQLLAALREKGGEWEAVDRAALERMIATGAKRRHELDGDRIRALYGHSVPGRIRCRAATPPARLFHGTAPETWAAIRVDGLWPMRRQFVHLSVDRETAQMVGQRKSVVPVLLMIDAAAAVAAGTPFYEGSEFVWLADCIPARFIAPEQ
ncbi:RNA 2'-phosphotransferase [Naumannella sp. ID2617S]|nr:RNA 2'-phosphotransferase [Naumannella sp. ID2617S]